MEEKNKTPLYKKHVELNANIVDFANYRMPMQYSSIFKETKAVRNSAGLFDVSHMGEIEVSGDNATEFINCLVTFDISKIKDFQAKYTVMLNERGGIIDDLLIYKLEEKYLIVVNASNQKKDFDWIKKHENGGVEVQNVSENYFQIALQGPLSEKIIKRIVKNDPSDLKFYHSKKENILDIPVLLSRTGYTGEDGFEVYGKSSEAEKIWDRIMKEGKQYDISPCGLGARDLLRLEMGYCLYGNDITAETTPLEANLSWVVSLDKKNFIGKDVLLKQKEEGVKRKLVGILVPGKRIPRHGNRILIKQEEVGIITSGNYSPNMGSSIALGYISKPYDKVGTKVEIEIRNTATEGEIIKLPFWKHGTVKKTSLEKKQSG
ncbi:glycine cleavage system aminomethyltransferase GcvT [candidate division WOR-3 bacterium]|nr:glycine cleavage system aminomethyltransferase GcvT [candidate division WOR-3 bacterium]